MAEEEIAKHTKKIYKIWFSKEHDFLHKLGEFFLEICIIVFAVTISIWFHNMSEHRRQQAEVKAFMMGLKSDLQNDIKEMKTDRDSYLNQKRIFTYISSMKMKEMPNVDTITKYNGWIMNFTEFIPDDGRFQGFKSSGKIGEIENDSLQNDIMDLYEENIPSLLTATHTYLDIKKRLLFDVFLKNLKRITDSTTNYFSLFKMDEYYNLSIALATPNQVIERYDLCIQLMNKIIGEIDKQYTLKIN